MGWGAIALIAPLVTPLGVAGVNLRYRGWKPGTLAAGSICGRPKQNIDDICVLTYTNAVQINVKCN